MKEYIAEIVDQERVGQQLSIRDVAKMAGIHHPQYLHITSANKGYTIDLLLKVLKVLNLEIKIVPKKDLSL